MFIHTLSINWNHSHSCSCMHGNRSPDVRKVFGLCPAAVHGTLPLRTEPGQSPLTTDAVNIIMSSAMATLIPLIYLPPMVLDLLPTSTCSAPPSCSVCSFWSVCSSCSVCPSWSAASWSSSPSFPCGSSEGGSLLFVGGPSHIFGSTVLSGSVLSSGWSGDELSVSSLSSSVQGVTCGAMRRHSDLCHLCLQTRPSILHSWLCTLESFNGDEYEASNHWLHAIVWILV